MPALLLAGCAVVPERFERSAPLIGTEVRIVAYGGPRTERAVERAFERVRELDGVFSDYREDSELSRLAARSATGAPTAPVPVSHELFAVLAAAVRTSEETAGAFDVTVGPYVRLWRRTQRQGRLPSEERLAEARVSVGWRHLQLDPDRRTVRLLAPDMRLDLGASPRARSSTRS